MGAKQICYSSLKLDAERCIELCLPRLGVVEMGAEEFNRKGRRAAMRVRREADPWGHAKTLRRKVIRVYVGRRGIQTQRAQSRNASPARSGTFF